MWQAGATLRCSERASHCGGFSCCGARALGTWASVVVAHGLSSCGSRALPGPGLEPVFPALAGGFLTTAPPGKPSTHLFNNLCIGMGNTHETSLLQTGVEWLSSEKEPMTLFEL